MNRIREVIMDEVSFERRSREADTMTSQEILEALKEHPFTQGLDEPCVSKLAALAREVAFQEDEIIFRAGERSRDLYLVLSGSVCIEMSTPVYAVCIQALGHGGVFGWSSLIRDRQTAFQVRAREKSIALCLDGCMVSAVCRDHPELGFELFRRLLRVVAGRLEATESKLAEFCGFAAPA